MNIKEIGQILQSDLGSSYTVVINPDHPRLFVAPDILIGGQGTLTAIFQPKMLERRMPDELLVRLTVSRLALPSHLRCVLLIDSHTWPETDFANLQRYFHTVRLGTKFRSISNFITNEQEDYIIEPITPKVREAAYTQANLFFDESIRRSSHNRTASEPRDVMYALRQQGEFKVAQVPSWTGRERRYSESLYMTSLLESTDTIVAGVSFAGHGSVLDRLRPYCNAAIKMAYRVDNGTPYSTEYASYVKILVSDEFPHTQYDSEKPLRAAAFAGWVVTPVQSVEELEGYTVRVKEDLQEVLGELQKQN